MRWAYEQRRIADFAAAVRRSRALVADERRPRAELEALKQRRLDAVVRHAAAHSPFYRERLAGAVADGGVRLEALPTLTKAEMMDNWDELVTDRRLRRDELLGWITEQQQDDAYLGEFRVMTTSGSSGRKGLFVYDRDAWRWVLAMFLRQGDTLGITPRLPRRRRIASLHGIAQEHMSRQVGIGVGVGVHNVRLVPATTPVAEAVATLNSFQPDTVAGYPSIVGRLAEEQLRGRLDISPSIVVTSSERQPPELAARLRAAFGCRPYDVFASTEGLWGIDCEEHDGVHLFEDLTLVENVDEDGRPVPPGETGARLLVTSLVNRTQPIIRLELTDAMALGCEPCACGRTLVRARTIEGRRDDLIDLPGANGRSVVVPPIAFDVVSGDPDVVEFQIVQQGARLDVRVVPRERVNGELEERLRQRVASRLSELGALDTEVHVERVAGLERTAGGKLQLIVADRSR